MAGMTNKKRRYSLKKQSPLGAGVSELKYEL